ncbi:hypothetical protein N7468_007990 [Penicillium chermesinum]|uniref:Uncharacterized protein n=1 Tax=Penicillium chermesinum TaxID=63820 RepID=A0A9W9NR91_9EURO|nr:uncharacterized protein N7468_007990 [Penicillium chermesinum]KAJ5223448.1 hypothetical protein N7468_007990 [Penicillium chermesinum]
MQRGPGYEKASQARGVADLAEEYKIEWPPDPLGTPELTDALAISTGQRSLLSIACYDLEGYRVGTSSVHTRNQESQSEPSSLPTLPNPHVQVLYEGHCRKRHLQCSAVSLCDTYEFPLLILSVSRYACLRAGTSYGIGLGLDHHGTVWGVDCEGYCNIPE